MSPVGPLALISGGQDSDYQQKQYPNQKSEEGEVKKATFSSQPVKRYSLMWQQIRYRGR